MAHSKQQNTFPETICDDTLPLGLLDKDFKTTVFYMLREKKENMGKRLKKII